MLDGNYGQRLIQWRESQGFSQRSLSAALGVSRGYIGDIEAGRSEPSRNFLQRLSEHFRVNSAWVLEGRDPMVFDDAVGFTSGLGEGPRVMPPDLQRPAPGDINFGGEDFVFVRRYDVNLSAGPGLIPAENAEADQLAFSRHWMLANGINNQLCGLVRVRGDSMAPTIPNGALVLVHLPEMTVLAEGVFAFSRGGSAFIKRIIPAGIGPDGRASSLVILSDNSAYPAEAISGPALNEIRIVGRVRCVMFSL